MDNGIHVELIDHLVLTVRDIDETCRFYSRVLGMVPVVFGDNRKALSFGLQKINLHQYGQEFSPKASVPTPGSADLCFITSVPIDKFGTHLALCGVEVIEGPVVRTGARGALKSVYFRDPDGNLIEVSNYKTV